jgi:hypothetical protein
MINKFSEAIAILWRNLGLFTAIVLTVWLPGNILVNFVAYNYVEVSDLGIMKLTMWIEGIFGPIYIGALVYALYQIKMGKTVTYKKAMSIGFKKWGSLFAARFVASLIMGLGLIAFIIPGIILAVRYSLIDAAVVIEDKGASESRVRSIDLTAGRRWQIFWAAILFFIPFMIVSFTIYMPLGFFESLNIMPVEVMLDCILDVAFAVIQIVVFLFYWESIQPITRAEPAAGADGVTAAAQP